MRTYRLVIPAGTIVQILNPHGSMTAYRATAEETRHGAILDGPGVLGRYVYTVGGIVYLVSAADVTASPE